MQNATYGVVLDNMIWVYDTWLLRDPLGASLLHALQVRPGIIGLPEVSKVEIVKNISAAYESHIDKIKRSQEKLRLILGDEVALNLPDQAKLEQSITARFNALEQFLLPLGNNLEAAYNRVIQSIPPCHVNQQFKDSLIWEAVLELSKRFPVHFVTKDNAFYEEAKSNDMHHLLAKELSSRQVFIYRKIEDLLRRLLQEFGKFPTEQFIPPLRSVLEDYFVDYASKRGLILITTDGRKNGHMDSVEAFLTHDPRLVSLKFTIYRHAGYYSENVQFPVEGYISASGSCFVTRPSNEIRELQLKMIQFTDLNGETDKGFGRILYATSAGRERFLLKYPLSFTEEFF